MRSFQGDGGEGKSTFRHRDGLRWKFGAGCVAAAIALGLAATGRGFDEALPALPAAQPAAQEPAPQEPGAGEAEGEGLQGILPAEVPFGLTFEDFAVLDGAWEDWSADVAETVAKLYESDEPLSIAEQRELLARLEYKLEVMERALGDPRYRAISDKLISVHGRLLRRVEVATAVLDVLEMDLRGSHEAELSAARQGLQTATTHLETYLSRVPNGAAWLPYVGIDGLRSGLAADAPPEAVASAAEQTLSALASREQLEDETQRQFLSRPPFLALEEAAGRYLAVAGRPNGNGLTQQLRDELAALVEAAEAYESESALNAADRMREALARIAQMSPAAGDRLELVLRKYYFNYNLQLLVSESFLARWISDARCQFQPMCEYSEGARITGGSVTRTVLNFDLKPSPENARFDILLNGNTQANTRADANIATVHAQGYHNFYATKSGTFDGEYFATQRAYVNVNPNTRITDVSTSVDWIPIIGWIANGIATSEAESRLPRANATAAQRIIQRAGSELDREVDSNFAKVTHDLQTGTFQRLRDNDLYPQHTRVSSSDLYVRISSLVKMGDETAGNLPSATLSPGRGLTAHVHESLLNNAANRLGFEGRTMTDQQVEQEIEAFLSDVFGRKVDLGDDDQAGGTAAVPPAPQESSAEEAAEEEDGSLPNTYVFDDRDAIRFQIDNGTVNVTLRAGFKREGQDDIPPQVITVPLTPRLEGKFLYFDRGAVRVAPRDRPENLATQIARAGIIRRKIERDFGELKRDRKIVFERDEDGDIVTFVMKVKALNGWLTVWVE